SHRITAPAPVVLTPAPDSKPSSPIWLGSIGEMRYESRVQLPTGYTPELPANIDLKEDFAEYYTAYSVKDGALAADRKLILKAREVPPSEYEAYKEFAKKVTNDRESYIVLTSKNAAARGYQDEIWELPFSDNADASKAYDDAVEAYQRKEGA